MKIVRCLGCKGGRTIPSMGMMGRKPCPVCEGKGFEKVYEDPIKELEQTKPMEEAIIEKKAADKAKKKK